MTRPQAGGPSASVPDLIYVPGKGWTYAAPDPSVTNESVKHSYSPAQIANGRSIMETVRRLASLEEDRTGLLVHFDNGVLPGLEREKLFQFISAVANADVVLTEHARTSTSTTQLGNGWAKRVR